jgi:hypothetical protein
MNLSEAVLKFGVPVVIDDVEMVFSPLSLLLSISKWTLTAAGAIFGLIEPTVYYYFGGIGYEKRALQLSPTSFR